MPASGCPSSGLARPAAACAGAGLGLLAFGPGLLSALCAMVPQYLGFNLFHLDGLLDSADAAGASGGVEKRRAVLKDPRIGSFALFAGFAALSGRLGAISSLLTGGSAAAWGALGVGAGGWQVRGGLVPSMAEPYGIGRAGIRHRTAVSRISTTGYAIAAIPGTFLFGIAYGAVGAMASILAGGLVAIAVSAATAPGTARASAATPATPWARPSSLPNSPFSPSPPPSPAEGAARVATPQAARQVAASGIMFQLFAHAGIDRKAWTVGSPEGILPVCRGAPHGPQRRGRPGMGEKKAAPSGTAFLTHKVCGIDYGAIIVIRPLSSGTSGLPSFRTYVISASRWNWLVS